MGTRAEHRALCPLVVRALSPTPSNLANHSKLPRICNAFRSLTRRSTARPFLLDWKIRFRGNVFHDHGRKAKYTQRVAGRRVRRHSGSPCTRFRRSRGGDSARSWCDSSLVSRFEQETRVHGTRKFALRLADVSTVSSWFWWWTEKRDNPEPVIALSKKAKATHSHEHASTQRGRRVREAEGEKGSYLTALSGDLLATPERGTKAV